MTDDINKLKIEIEELTSRCQRQHSIIKALHQEIERFQGQGTDIPFIQCFFAMPFDNKYDSLFSIVKSILEDAPYGWKLVRADTEHKAPTIHLNVEKHISSSHCYLADISERNANVFLEIGRMSHYNRLSDFEHNTHRPLVYLYNESSKEEIASDLQGLIYYSYQLSSSDPCKIQEFTDSFKKELQKQSTLEDLRTTKKKEAFLSIDTLIYNKMCSKELARKLTKKFVTVESLLNTKPRDVANQLNIPEEVQEIFYTQYSLAEHFMMKMTIR
jgi:molecular chaperone HtpG